MSDTNGVFWFRKTLILLIAVFFLMPFEEN